MVWLLRLLWILAAAITSLFVARDALNFGIIETLLMITLVVAVAVPCMENPPRILISRLVFELVSIIRSLRLNRLAVPANPAPPFDLGQGVVRWLA